MRILFASHKNKTTKPHTQNKTELHSAAERAGFFCNITHTRGRRDGAPWNAYVVFNDVYGWTNEETVPHRVGPVYTDIRPGALQDKQRLVGWMVGWLVGWLVCWLVGWLVGLLVGLLVGWSVGWLVGLLVGWLVGWLAGWFVCVCVCVCGSRYHGWFIVEPLYRM